MKIMGHSLDFCWRPSVERWDWSHLRELRFCSRLGTNRTLARHRPDFHTYAIRETGAFRGDFNRFVHRGDAEKKIATNRLLGFGEWAIGHDTVLTRNYFPLSFH